MTLDKAVAVDFSQETATSSVILPPKLSSHHADWTGMYLQYHDCPSHETPEHYPTQHVIAIQTKGMVEAERKLGDRYRREQIRVGDVCLVPAYTRHWIRAEGTQGLILLGIEPDAISKILPNDLDIQNIELLPHFAQADPLIYHLVLSLKKALQLNTLDSRFYAESLSIALIAHLMQFYTAKNPITNDVLSEDAQIKQAKDYIHAYLTEKLSLQAIADAVGMSKYHFCRIFKQSTGLSPWQYVIQQRIELAKQLLKNSQLSIWQISDRLGYSNSTQFTNFFRQHTGITPSDFRK